MSDTDTRQDNEYLNQQIYGAAVRLCQAYDAKGDKSKEEVLAAVLLNAKLIEDGQNLYKGVVISFEDTGFDPEQIVKDSANSTP